MSSTLVIPETLKAVKPYITLATQLDQRGEKFVPYYVRLYALQHGMSINKSAPECKKFLLQLMDMLEATKAQMKNEEAIQSQIVGQALVEKLALSIFHKADAEDREAKFTKNLVKQFYSSGLLFDSLNYFGDLSEDLVQKKQYAKRKAMYLNKCFQTGETPIAGPLIGEELDGEGNQNDGESDNNPGPSPPSVPANYYPQSNPSPKPRANPAPEQRASYQQETAHQTDISPEAMVKAQKLCKFASSALQYEDVPTAIKNLEECLSLLKNGQ